MHKVKAKGARKGAKPKITPAAKDSDARAHGDDHGAKSDDDDIKGENGVKGDHNDKAKKDDHDDDIRNDKKTRGKSGHQPFRFRIHETREHWYRFVYNADYDHVTFSTGKVADCKHPWESRQKDAPYSWNVDGTPGRAIRLWPNERYAFSVVSEAVGPLMLTLDPCGGPEATGLVWDEVTLPLITPGTTLVLRVKTSFPVVCFYQDPKIPYLGGALMRNKETDSDSDSYSGSY